MIVCFSADWHISNFGEDKRGPITERGSACLRVIERLYAVDNVDLHVGLGDIFDTDKPSPSLIGEVMRKILKKTYFIVGNHDQTSAVTAHNALYPLSSVATVVEDSETFDLTTSTQLSLLGFRYRDDILATIQGIRWRPGAKYRILGIHMGVGDERTPTHLRGSAGSVDVETLSKICSDTGVTHVFCGDWHNPSDWLVNGVAVCQVGGLIPQRFGDTHDVHGRVALFDTDTGAVTFKTLAGPRFVTVEGDPPWDVPEVEDADPLHVRYLTDAKNRERALIEAEALGLPCKVVPPKASKSTTTTEVTLNVDVPLPETVALQAAHVEGGVVLVDLLKKVFTEVRK